jgi:quercetin dioxygenase-like cupin family protein
MYEQGIIVGSHQIIPDALHRGASGEDGAPIRLTDIVVDVDAAVEKLDGSEWWNYHGPRREKYAHNATDDLWVRYNDWGNYDQRGLAAFNLPHESVWYPVTHDIPELQEIVAGVLENLGDVELGGVLITRIPPGGGVAPHRDTGWHAEYYYDKYGVQLQGNDEQSFNFKGYSLSPEPGEVFWFNNQEQHWVHNDSDEDRMTMIICVRPKENAKCLGV